MASLRPRIPLLVLLLGLVPPAGCRRHAADVARWDRPMREVWPAAGGWGEADEAAYSAFVARLGEAVAERRCRRLGECLRDPAANLLHDEGDARLEVPVDCADLPYTLRAYFAFKGRLPFAYVASVRGAGADPRYLRRAEPVESRSWQDHGSAAELLLALRRTIHSGMLRMAPEEEGGDFYPIVVRREAVVPGAVFYDPNGHVLVVARVRDDGMIYFIDAHPDGSLTYRRLGAAFEPGPRPLGGGLKRFRPLRIRDGQPQRLSNRELPDFDAASQWDPATWRGPAAGAAPRPYHAWVRASLRVPGATVSPEQELREQIQALCRAIEERGDAVALAGPLSRLPHPAALPPNIYGASGEWEVYATPARDARLKAIVAELRDTAAALRAGDGAPPPAALSALWQEEAGRPGCSARYTDSRGGPVALGLDAVLDRLFRLSFDPYHCPELRWGAGPGSRELGRCPDGGDKFRWYEAEGRLRNRTGRVYGVPTPLADGPAEPPDIDPRPAFD